MTKSTKHGKVVYNFLDNNRDNVVILQDAWVENGKPIYPLLNILAPANKDEFFIDRETAADLIKVLQEFVDTGELK